MRESLKVTEGLREAIEGWLGDRKGSLAGKVLPGEIMRDPMFAEEPRKNLETLATAHDEGRLEEEFDRMFPEKSSARNR